MCRHHTMGGAKINTKAQVIDRDGQVIPIVFMQPVKLPAEFTGLTVSAEMPLLISLHSEELQEKMQQPEVN